MTFRKILSRCKAIHLPECCALVERRGGGRGEVVVVCALPIIACLLAFAVLPTCKVCRAGGVPADEINFGRFNYCSMMQSHCTWFNALRTTRHTLCSSLDYARSLSLYRNISMYTIDGNPMCSENFASSFSPKVRALLRAKTSFRKAHLTRLVFWVFGILRRRFSKVKLRCGRVANLNYKMPERILLATEYSTGVALSLRRLFQSERIRLDPFENKEIYLNSWLLLLIFPNNLVCRTLAFQLKSHTLQCACYTLATAHPYWFKLVLILVLSVSAMYCLALCFSS